MAREACMARIVVADNDLDAIQHRRQLFEGNDLVRSTGQQCGAFDTTCTHDELQLPGDELGHGLGGDQAGTHDQRETGRSGGVGPCCVEAELGQPCGCAAIVLVHATADCDRRPEEAVEVRSDCARLASRRDRGPDLSEDLPFAFDPRFESGGNAEEVAGDVGTRAVPRVRVGADEIRVGLGDECAERGIEIEGVAGEIQLGNDLDDAGSADPGDAGRGSGLCKSRLVRPQVAADHLDSRLECRGIDTDALDRARRSALAAADLRTLERRPCGARAGEQPVAVAEDDLGVGADIDDERHRIRQVGPLGEHHARGVGADVPGDAGR